MAADDRHACCWCHARLTGFAEKNGKQKRVVNLTDEYIMSLENYLNNYKGTVIVVSHDRYFLDRVANRTLELEKAKIYSYQANYSKFLEMKAERED